MSYSYPSLPTEQPVYPVQTLYGGMNYMHVNPTQLHPPYVAVQHKQKFESALDFLERVKTVFEDQAEVYKQFLDVMKEFKVHNIDTPGVIQRVKLLFAGHPELILGFNTFLPQGYKITEEELHVQHPSVPYVPPNVSQTTQPYSSQINYGHLVPPTPIHPPIQTPGHTVPPTPVQPSGVGAIPTSQTPAYIPPKGKPEFAQEARSYVKKIKARFASELHIYRAFLGILHSFHDHTSEQQSISDVYNQVAKLFKDHKDLIDDFSQFLPDISGGQLPPRALPALPASVERSSEDQKKKSFGQQSLEELQLPQPKQPRSMRVKRAPRFDALNSISGSTTTSPGTSTIDAQLQNQLLQVQSQSTSQVQPAQQRPQTPAPLILSDIELFIRIKLSIPQKWQDLLKCLELYNCNVFSKHDVLLLVREILPYESEYGQNFWNSLRELMGVDVDEFSDDDDVCLGDLDLSGCERNGLSYRRRPRQYKLKECSGRTELDASVLNDEWISRPTGEEGGFKSSRKNEYEELLFKCEDDRFEWDLIAERNLAAARALDTIYKTIKNLPKAEQQKYKIAPDKLSVLTKIAVRTIYGARGADLEKYLMDYPSILIPIVVARLRQKDTEWAVAKNQWSLRWRRMYEEYFLRSLDHESMNYKTEQKHRLSPNEIWEELKQKMLRRSKSPSGSSHFIPSVGDIVFKPGTNSTHLFSFVPSPSASPALSSLVLSPPPLPPIAIEIPKEFYVHSRALASVVCDRIFGNQEGVKERVSEILKTLDCFFVTSTTKNSMFNFSMGFDFSSLSISEPKDTSTNRVFLLDANLVVLLRFFQILFRMLEAAYQICADFYKPPYYTPPTHLQPLSSTSSTPSLLHGIGDEEFDADSIALIKKEISLWKGEFFNSSSVLTNTTTNSNNISDSTSSSNSTQQKNTNTETSPASVASRRYYAYLALLSRLLANALEQSSYEEICRENLGVKSYPLFAMDRLVVGIGRQIGVVASDPLSMRLCQLYVNDSGERANRDDESAYFSHLANFLSAEDRVYRAVYHAQTFEFSISQLDRRWRPTYCPPPIPIKLINATELAPDSVPIGYSGSNQRKRKNRLPPPEEGNSYGGPERNKKRGGNSSAQFPIANSKERKDEDWNSKQKTPKIKEKEETSTAIDGTRIPEHVGNSEYAQFNNDPYDSTTQNLINCVGIVNMSTGTIIHRIGENGVPPETARRHQDFIENPPKFEIGRSVYLKRNLDLASRDLGDHVMRETLFVNQLEFAIDSVTFRPVYLEGTEERFLRRRRAKNAPFNYNINNNNSNNNNNINNININIDNSINTDSMNITEGTESERKSIMMMGNIDSSNNNLDVGVDSTNQINNTDNNTNNNTINVLENNSENKNDNITDSNNTNNISMINYAIKSNDISSTSVNRGRKFKKKFRRITSDEEEELEDEEEDYNEEVDDR